jgi:hypothetical protein
VRPYYFVGIGTATGVGAPAPANHPALPSQRTIAETNGRPLSSVC